MEYTEEQIEEAVRVWEADNDKSWVDLAKLIMRMMREEAKAAKLYARLCDQSHGALNPTPPEFWKEHKKPATESQWRQIETAPRHQFVIVARYGFAPVVAVYHVKSEGWETRSEAVEFEPTHWMPIPELPMEDGA